MKKFLPCSIFVLLSLAVSMNLAAQSGNATIKGTVIDVNTGEPLIGTNVAIQGTSLGTSTNLNGEYIIPNIPAGTHELVYRYIGYKQIELAGIVLAAGETLVKDIEMSPEAIMGEEAVVTMQAKGQRAAINQQLASNAITNIVSSDKIRDVPDVNAAESIGRLPGVSLQRSGGEGERVVIRGLSPKYSVIEVDGVRMEGSSSDRSVGLSTVSSEMLDGIELSKTLTADKDADAIGGVVNLRTRVADDGFHFNAYGTGTYNNLHNSFGNYRLSGSVGNRFFDNKFGVLVSGGIERVDRSADEFAATYGRIIEPIGGGEILETQRANLTETKRIRERANASLVLDYRTDFMSLKFNNIYSRRSDNIERRNAVYRFDANNYDFNISESFPEESFQLHSLSAEFNLGNTVLDVDGSYSKSNSDRYEDLYLHEDREPLTSLIDPNKLEFAHPADLIRDYYEDDLTPERAGVRWNERENEVREDVSKTLNANWKIPYRIGNVSGFIKTGVRYKEKVRSSDQTTTWTAFHGGIGDINMDRFYQYFPDFLKEIDVGSKHGSIIPAANWPDNDYDFGNFLDGRYNFSWTTDLEALKETFNEFYNLVDADSTIALRKIHRLRGAQSYEDDYETREKLMAGYVMAEINIGKRIMLLPGIRYENIQTEYTSNFVLTDGFDPAGLYRTPESVTALRENGNWFPSLNMRVNVNDWMDVRGAYYKSASRPDFSLLSPSLTREYDGFDVSSYNPYLWPALAHNFDLGVSFYTNKLGLFTLNGFYKDISELIYRIPDYEPGFVQNLEATGAPSSLIESLTAPEVLYDSIIYGPNFTNDDKPINNPNKSTYYGLEISWQSNFWYLPGLWSGLVLDLNYTMIWSSTELPYMGFVEGIDSSGFFPITVYQAVYETRESRMLDQPSNIFNARIGWDYKGFSTRLSFRYQGSTITRIDPLYGLLDEFNTALFRIDLNARQQITERLAVSLDITNLNNYIDDRIVSAQGMEFPRRSEYYGMNVTLGVRYDF